MRLAALFTKHRQGSYRQHGDIRELTHAGSWIACTAACIAACALIFSAGAQNVSHAWSLGAAHSEFRAAILAIASAGATLLAPLAFAAISHAFRKRRFGGALVALMLGTGALAYAAVNSLGFVHGSRDSGITERVAAADTYADRRALAKAAKDELATLKGTKPEIAERRAELTAILVNLTDGKAVAAKPATADAQAHALAFYIRAVGWKVDDADVGVWLSAGMVLFLEVAAALSLTVASALAPIRPARVAAPPAATVPAAAHHTPAPDVARPDPQEARRGASKDDQDRSDDPPPPPPSRKRGKAGRPATVLHRDAVERIRARGGAVQGSLREIGRTLGVRSKTTAHRLLHGLASAGLVQLATGPTGVRVALA